VFADGRTVSIIGHEGERRTVEAVDAEGRRDWTFDDASQAAQARAFVRAVRDGRPDAVASTYENGMRTLAVTLAMHRSCETGQPVAVAV
jgi:myo-inositol 2-dehydrogenase / D-chiro-inositol 1-dehydrogenase